MAEVAASAAFQVGERTTGKAIRAVLAAASAASECSSRLTVEGAAPFGATAIYASNRMSQDNEVAVRHDAENY